MGCYIARTTGNANGAAMLSIRGLDPRTKGIMTLVDAVAGAREADCAWMLTKRTPSARNTRKGS
jgi:hypothetical protein